MPHYPDEIEYSEKYSDDIYEYRHVLLPKNIFKTISKGKLLAEMEWRNLGVQQSRGWVHYEIHGPEPHILLFRRPIGTDPNTGLVPSNVLQKIQYMQSKLEDK
jgi:cyclin-dependent kinase regulatory subunit CKS1